VKKKAFALLLLLSLLLPTLSFAAGQATTIGTINRFSRPDGYNFVTIIPITFVADNGTAAFATTTINPTTYKIEGWYLYKVKTDPGATGPSNGAWDLDITDAEGYLISQNLVDNRSSTTTQEVKFTSGFPTIDSTWTLSIADNVVNSASVVVYLHFRMQ
jgi:hypothetical protein